MRYFIDTEFHEGFHKPLFGKKRHFIDLISMGIVAEDGREYYAISKDFDLKSVWNKYDLDYGSGDQRNLPPRKIYWLRDNVLKPIFEEWKMDSNGKIVRIGLPVPLIEDKFTYKNFKKVIKSIGKSNKQIAEEITKFVSMDYIDGYGEEFTSEVKCDNHYIKSNPEFYGYYADYDWVLFCSLFGRMIDLPKGFPMMCFDIQQMITEHKIDKNRLLKDVPQTNEHNALSDAVWNFNAYKWIKSNMNEKR